MKRSASGLSTNFGSGWMRILPSLLTRKAYPSLPASTDLIIDTSESSEKSLPVTPASLPLMDTGMAAVMIRPPVDASL
ncbi:hypothetical protein D3C78_1901380 [compost metagenome]